MARMVVIYRRPRDVDAFDQHYFQTHVPLAKKLPGLRKYEVSHGPIATPAGASDFHLVATLHFDDLAAIKQAFASAEGQPAQWIGASSHQTIRKFSCSSLTTGRCKRWRPCGPGTKALAKGLNY